MSIDMEFEKTRLNGAIVNTAVVTENKWQYAKTIVMRDGKCIGEFSAQLVDAGKQHRRALAQVRAGQL